MEPEIACRACGGRVPLGAARRVVGGVRFICGRCGEAVTWPTPRPVTADAQEPPPPAPTWS
jgi:hypothetical protein